MRTPANAPVPSSAHTLPRLILVATAVSAFAAGSACMASGGNSRVFVTPPRASSAPAPAITLPPPPMPAARSQAAGVFTDTAEVRIRVTDDQGTRVIAMPLDEYVVGAVRAELSPQTTPGDVANRVLEVQAIVSRTYALASLGRHRAEGFDLCDSTHCQLYRRPLRKDRTDDPAARAVAATHGQVITFDGRPIQAVFHSSCGGHTAAASDVWNGTGVPYLRPVPDWFCSRGHETHWEFQADAQAIRQALNANARTATGSRLDRIDIFERDAAGRASRVVVAGTRTAEVRAEEFRSVMRQAFGPKSIQSTWFAVTRRNRLFVFTGVGYGHGVGLCQTGAALRAHAGQTPSAILAHYFPGTQIEPVPLRASAGSRPRPVPASY